MTSVLDPREDADLVAPGAALVLADVARGLSLPQKELSPKYFYDRRGSELFEAITRLPEYYLTRAETALLTSRIGDVVGALRPATLVELGAGSGEKTRLVLDAMRAHGDGTVHAYVPIDVSEEFLAETADRLRAEYPGLDVLPMVADIGLPLALDADLERPLLFAFLGSTIGNFERSTAINLLRRVRRSLTGIDRLLLGVDLRKDVATIERAYNDSAGVTVAFNRNMLAALNASLGADFDPEAFEHLAFYDRQYHRMEMYLVATCAMTVTIPGTAPVAIGAGESIRTEISCKYDRASVTEMFVEAGLAVERWITDEAQSFALVVGAAESRQA